MSSLAGHTAVVTGITSGIGLTLARRLLAEKATVIGIGRGGRARLAGLGLGDGFEPISMDLAQRNSRAQGIYDVLSRFDRIDIVVNNAAECVYELPLALNTQRWERLLEVNLVATIDLLHAFVPRIPKGGQIVNLSSVTASFVPAPRYAPYALTKTAVAALTESLRLELAQRGIKVSSVTPGLVDTPIYTKIEGFTSTAARLYEQVPCWLTADDVAEAIVWMLTRPGHVVVGDLVLLPLGQPR